MPLNNNEWLNEISRIEDELKNIITSDWLPEIIELTYKYKIYTIDWKEFYFNSDLFERFLWNDYWDKPILDQNEYTIIKDNLTNKINEIINKLEEILKRIKKIEYIEKNILDFYIWWIENIINVLKYTLNSIDFELEKGWYEHNLSEEGIKKKIEENEEYEKEIYWWKVIDNEDEAIMSYQFIVKHIDKNNTKLDENELKRLNDYRSKLQKELLKNWYDLDKDYWFNEQSEIHKDTNEFLHLFWEMNIKRDEVIEIFNLVFEMLGLRQRAKKSNRWNIYDWPDFLEIPENEEYETLELKRILNLIAHEILWHYINQRNHEKFIWNTRWKWNVEKEEWLAKIYESFNQWKNIFESSPISAPFSRILFWEVLDTEEFKDLIFLYHKMWIKIKPLDSFLRHKRNQPLDYVTVQHKDTGYIRGHIRLLKYLQEWWDIFKLSNWKVSIESIENWNIDFSNNNDYMIPFLITDIIMYRLLQKNMFIDSPLSNKSFEEYIWKKYWYLWIEFTDKYKKLQLNRTQKLILGKIYTIIKNRAFN